MEYRLDKVSESDIKSPTIDLREFKSPLSNLASNARAKLTRPLARPLTRTVAPRATAAPTAPPKTVVSPRPTVRPTRPIANKPADLDNINLVVDSSKLRPAPVLKAAPKRFRTSRKVI